MVRLLLRSEPHPHPAGQVAAGKRYHHSGQVPFRLTRCCPHNSETLSGVGQRPVFTVEENESNLMALRSG